VAAELGGPGTAAVVLLRGRPYDITVASVADAFPGMSAGTTRFVVLPWQAMPADAVVVANRLLVSGARADAAALRAAGDEGQRAYVRAWSGREPNGLDNPTALVRWEQARRALDRTGANSLLSFTFSIGLLGGAALALLAVGLAVLIGARPRGQVLSRLRTMGLDAGAGRRLLLVELVPMVGLAVLLGAVLGTALPGLLRPALELTEFTAGVVPVTRVHPLLLVALPVLVALALAVAVGVESVVNRRMRLGEALRIAEER
jgi:putative ABC transport system permease protein